MLATLERRLEQGQWILAKEEAERLRVTSAKTMSDLQLGKLYFGYGRASAHLREWYAAVDLFQRAIHHAFQARDWDTLGFSRAELGIVSVFIDDHAVANEAFATYYLDYSRYREAKACEGHVRYNNALSLRRQRRVAEAVVSYHLALDFYVERGKTRDAADCQQNLAWLYLLENQHEMALPHLECAQSYVDALTPDYRVKMLVSWALYHLGLRQLGTAMEYVAEVMGASPKGSTHAGVTAHHKSEAAWIGGQVALLLNRLDQANVLAKATLDFALVAGEPGLMNRANRLLAEISQSIGEQGEAAH